MFKKIIFTVISLSFVLAACSPPTATPDTMMKESATPDAMMEKTDDTMMDELATPDAMMEKTDDAMMDESATPDAMMEKTDDTMMDASATPDAMGSSGMMEAPAWFSAQLTDVTTGDTFSIDDFKGKVVLVETMAAWCSSCLKQQTQVKQLDELLGMPADLVRIGLAIDPNEDTDIIKTYIESKGFNWTYAVSPVEVSREISDLYGTQFLNPPSTPILLIDRSGKVIVLPFGIKSAEDLKQQIEPLLSAGM